MNTSIDPPAFTPSPGVPVTVMVAPKPNVSVAPPADVVNVLGVPDAIESGFSGFAFTANVGALITKSVSPNWLRSA